MKARFPIAAKWQWARNVSEIIAKLVPLDVPFSLVQDHERQAQYNHSQSLEKLASRGGLSPAELYCIVHDVYYYRPNAGPVITEQAAAEWLISELQKLKEKS